MPISPRFPRPTPPSCRDCGGTQLEGLGQCGNWDGRFAGGYIYQARCLGCGTVWTRYGFGSAWLESPDDEYWGKEGSATDPPRRPPEAEFNPFLQITEGKAVSGVVANVAEFGLFVSLARGLDGVLLFDSTPCAEIARRLRVGDTLEVFVRSVDVERVKVYVELLPDPTRYERFQSQASAKDEFDANDQIFVRDLLLKPEDDALRMAYAEWLEQQRDRRGELLRLLVHAFQHESGRPSPKTARISRLIQQLGVSKDWLASVSRGCIKFCVRKGWCAPCPQLWERLKCTDVPSIRHCEVCERDVWFCCTESEVTEVARSKQITPLRILPGLENEQQAGFLIGHPVVKAFVMKSE